MDEDCGRCCLCVTFMGTIVTTIIFALVLLCLYTSPNPPEFSIEEFSVPAFNKTSDQISGDIYFDLKLRNMNKALGLYYDDPSNIGFYYYPPEHPYHKYVWVYTFPPFYQGNGKTKHITTTVMGKRSTVVVVDGVKDTHLRLPSSTVVVEKAVGVPVVMFRINLLVSYRFKLLGASSTQVLEVGADVMVYANTGQRVSEGRIKLV